MLVVKLRKEELRMPWSKRAREDFDERKEYRKERGEKDRYEKKDEPPGERDDLRSSDRKEDKSSDNSDREPDREERRDDNRSPRELEEAAKEDRREERGYYEDEWKEDDFEYYLSQIRNASPDDNVDDAIKRLRERYDYYERELDRYDADYDDLMAEVERLRKDNRRYMMRDSVRREGREAERMQDQDIKQDGEPQTFDDLWKNREG